MLFSLFWKDGVFVMLCFLSKNFACSVVVIERETTFPVGNCKF